jgi:hypothetical protein
MPKLINEVVNFSFKKICFWLVAEEINSFKWVVFDIEIPQQELDFYSDQRMHTIQPQTL